MKQWKIWPLIHRNLTTFAHWNVLLIPLFWMSDILLQPYSELNNLFSILHLITRWFELLIYHEMNTIYGWYEYKQAESDIKWYTSDIYGNGIRLFISFNFTNLISYLNWRRQFFLKTVVYLTKFNFFLFFSSTLTHIEGFEDVTYVTCIK